MTKINPDKLIKAYEMLEVGNNPQEVLALFPAEQKEIQEFLTANALILK